MPLVLLYLSESPLLYRLFKAWGDFPKVMRRVRVKSALSLHQLSRLPLNTRLQY
jgi:hypothetical protein